MRIQYMVSTIPREPFFLLDIMDALLKVSEEVDLVAGSPQIDYLDRWRDDRHYAVGMSATEKFIWQALPVEQRVSFNFLRCLVHGQFSKADYILALEDDIQFSTDWHRDLKVAIGILESELFKEATGISEWIFSLYVPPKMQRFPIWGTSPHQLFVVDRKAWYGNQGLLMSKAVALKVAQYVVRRSLFNTKPSDIVVAEYAHESGTPIILPEFSLVQHMGTKSTIPGERLLHQSECFKP